MAIDLHKLLEFAVANGASDIHLQALSPPMLRIGGQMRSIEGESLSDEALLAFIADISRTPSSDGLPEAMTAGLDFAYAIPGLTRFRCSAFRQLGKAGMVMRVIRSKIPSIEELHLPKVIQDIAMSRRGLTLVTGTTGSGKSTTLAAMLELINQAQQVKIITVEDPIEYVHTGKKAMISQLEVGLDTSSFEQALRQALRQNPDVILVGELRDVPSLRMALHAAMLAEAEKSGTLPVVLDMSGVGMIPSFSVGMLVAVWRQLGKVKRRFILVGLQPRVRETLAICRLDKVLDICESLQEVKTRLARADEA